MIVDTSATKPEDWLENEPETIPDPEAEKPEEWDVSCTWQMIESTADE
jgi:calnexin